MPAAARIPAWRIPPPYMRRKRRSFSTVGRSDTITDPTGAPSPLDKQNETVSKWRAYSAADTPVATTALEPRTVQVHRNPASAGHGVDPFNRGKRIDGAAPAVVGV